MSAAETAAVVAVAAALGVGLVIAVHVAVDMILCRAQAAAEAAAADFRAASRRHRTFGDGLAPGVDDPGPGSPPPRDSRCAAPGDHDLDLDVYNLVLDDVVHAGHDFMLAGTATDGAFVPVDAVVAGREPVVKIDMSATFGIPTAPTAQVDLYAAQLDAWVTERTPLRLVAAPGKVSLLWDPAPGGFAMPLPRT